MTMNKELKKNMLELWHCLKNKNKEIENKNIEIQDKYKEIANLKAKMQDMDNYITEKVLGNSKVKAALLASKAKT